MKEQLRAFADVADRLAAAAEHPGKGGAGELCAVLERAERLLATTRGWDRRLALLPHCRRSFGAAGGVFRRDAAHACVTRLADAVAAVLAQRVPADARAALLRCLALLARNAGVREHLARDRPRAADALVALVLDAGDSESERLAAEALCLLVPRNVNTQHAGFWAGLLHHSITAVTTKTPGFRTHLQLLAKVSGHDELKAEIKQSGEVKRFYRELIRLLNDADFGLVLSGLLILTNLIRDEKIGEKLFHESNNIRTFELIFRVLLTGNKHQDSASHTRLALLAVELFESMMAVPAMKLQLAELDGFLTYLRGICSDSDPMHSAQWLLRLLGVLLRHFPANEQIEQVIEESDVLGRAARAAEASLRRGHAFPALADMLDVVRRVVHGGRVTPAANLERCVKALAGVFHHLLDSEGDAPPVGMFELARFFVQIDPQKVRAICITHSHAIAAHLESNILALFSAAELSCYEALTAVWLYALAAREATPDELVVDNPFLMEIVYTVLVQSAGVDDSDEDEDAFRGVLPDCLGVVEWLCANKRAQFAEVVGEVNSSRVAVAPSRDLSLSFRGSHTESSFDERADSKLDFRYDDDNVVSMIPAPQQPAPPQQMSAPVRSFDFSILEEELDRIDKQAASAVQQKQQVEVKEYLETIENYKSDIDVFKAEIDLLRGKDSERAGAVAKLEQESARHVLEKQELALQVEAFESEVHGMTEQLSNYERIVKTYESETQEYNEIIETLERKAREQQKLFDEHAAAHEAQASAAQIEMDAIKQLNADLEAAKQSLEQQVDDLRDREIGLEAELRRQREYAGEIEVNLAAETDARAHAERKHAALADEHADAVAARDGEIERMGGVLQQLEDANRLQRDAVRREADRAAALEKEVQHYKSIVNQVMSGLSLFQQKPGGVGESSDRADAPRESDAVLDRVLGLE